MVLSEKMLCSLSSVVEGAGSATVAATVHATLGTQRWWPRWWRTTVRGSKGDDALLQLLWAAATHVIDIGVVNNGETKMFV